MSQGARAWGELTEGERAGWEAYALTIDRVDVFGNIYHAPGQCEFMANFAITMMVGEAPPTAAPVVANPGPVNGLNVYIGPAKWLVKVHWLPTVNVDFIEIMLTPVKSKGTMSVSGNDKIIHAIVNASQGMWTGPATFDGLKRQFKIRGLSQSGQWGPWTVGIVPPDYP